MNSKESQSVEGYPIDEKETWESSCEANLKPAINGLLWTYLPPATKLIDAENFACEIFERIRDMWED